MGTTYKRDKLRDFIKKLVLRKYDKVFSLFEISIDSTTTDTFTHNR